MGYYVYGGGTMKIKKENFQKVLDTIKEKYEWVNTETIEDAFSAFGFEPSIDQKSGDMTHCWFPDEKWRGCEEFLESLAPFVENGSHMEFTGEDGEKWRSSFFNGKYYETQGVTTYPGDPYDKEE